MADKGKTSEDERRRLTLQRFLDVGPFTVASLFVVSLPHPQQDTQRKTDIHVRAN
jgi:hypothetical protein